ncbi:uncharacterized protein LOC121863284 [Homarus americanus]|uniref:uncharacterized protein LOC121863284 n=1 Tax=Homarus americanus TaxID=6706 RepID=UPI001C46C3D7|nr:uncharacterized protein LOC121863284 [Homarus americanus]XP_042217798.1 uncharacterized protein LOC121863284 [Homarus americanus]
MEIRCLGNPNKIHGTCKLWIEGRCKKPRDVCEYLHSNFCPEKDKCKREHCPLHHINQLSKKLFPLRKTGIGNAKRKKCNQQKEAGLKTNSPTSSNNGASKSQSASPDWNLNSLAFDDFDEELCQGLEEVGQELDRFAEEVSEDSTCEDEILCLTEQKENYPSNISFKGKKPLKNEEAFKLACDQNR